MHELRTLIRAIATDHSIEYYESTVILPSWGMSHYSDAPPVRLPIHGRCIRTRTPTMAKNALDPQTSRAMSVNPTRTAMCTRLLLRRMARRCRHCLYFLPQIYRQHRDQE